MTNLFKNFNWPVVLFLFIVHAVAVYGVVHTVAFGVAWQSLLLGLFWLLACGLSITAGYHRLFSHPTYKASSIVKLFFLLFGSASFQNSALVWASDHRTHHTHTDHDADPYNIKAGFWWAHMGWLFYSFKPHDFSNVPDLMKDPLVRFQHRYQVPLAILVGFLVPLGLGTLWGDPLGAFFLAGPIRLVVQYHATWSINSVAHTIGSKTYSKTDSARDSYITALLTFGEGYHNFHHTFPLDYRNGIRKYHFDPTKWLIWTLSRFGLTSKLRRTPPALIQMVRASDAPVEESEFPKRRSG